MEKTDYVHKVDGNISKYGHKIVTRRNIRSRQSEDHKRMLEKKKYKLLSTEDEEGEDDDDDDDGDTLNGENNIGYANRRVGLCTACNLIIDSNHENSISQEPYLCHRCIKRLPVRSDTTCMLCETDSLHSNFSYSQTSSDNPSKVRTTRTYDIPIQAASSGAENIHTNSWVQGYTPAMSSGNKSISGCNMIHNMNSFSDWETIKDDYRERSAFQRSFYSIVKRDEAADASTVEMKTTNQVAPEFSRRPIRCPRLDCAVNIAFSALIHHFLFDHPEVPILSIDPGMKSTLIFSFTTLICDSSRCLALLLVSNKLSGSAAKLFNGSQIQQKYRNRLPLSVLAARLRYVNQYPVKSETYADAKGYDTRDVIIIWLAGLDVGNTTTGSLRCSIQAVDDIENEGFRSLTYTGPINSLRTAQSPKEVFLNGDCVVLHEGLLKHIASGCANLNVNVVVH